MVAPFHSSSIQGKNPFLAVGQDINEWAWRKTLEELPNDEENGLEFKRIIEKFLIPDNISPEQYADNWAARSKLPGKPSPSLQQAFLSQQGQTPGFPSWFIAAYPDVVAWLGESPKPGDVVWEVSNPECVEREDKERREASNGGDERCPPDDTTLRATLDAFSQKTGRAFECRCPESALASVEAFQAISAIHGGGDNFEIIARNITKLYLELYRNHKERFSNEVSLLAAAGILDAAICVFGQKSITVREIIGIAQASVSSGKDALVEFVVNMEVKLFTVDTPEMSPSRIQTICTEQRPRIAVEIRRTQQQHTHVERAELRVVRTLVFRASRL